MLQLNVPAGRKPTPEEKKFVARIIRAPREEWKRLDAAVPKGGRAVFIRRSVEIVLDDPALTERALRPDAAAPDRPAQD